MNDLHDCGELISSHEWMMHAVTLPSILSGKTSLQQVTHVWCCVHTKYQEQHSIHVENKLFTCLCRKGQSKTIFLFSFLSSVVRALWKSKRKNKHADSLNACCMRHRSLHEKIKTRGKGSLRASVIIVDKEWKVMGEKCHGNLPTAAYPGPLVPSSWGIGLWGRSSWVEVLWPDSRERSESPSRRVLLGSWDGSLCWIVFC